MKSLRNLLLLIVVLCSAQLSFGQSPEEMEDCKIQRALYREFYKQESFSEAFPHWRKLFNTCPSMSQYPYTDGPIILKSMIADTSDPTRKSQLVDTLMLVWDQRYKFFPTNKDGVDQKGYYIYRKAIDLLEVEPESKEKVFNLLSKALQLEGTKSEPRLIQEYFGLAIELAKSNVVDKLVILDGYEELVGILDEQIVHEKDSLLYRDISSVKSGIEAGFEPYATCDILLDIYQKRYDAAPNDIDVLKRITNMLIKKNCVKSDLFKQATESLHKIEPSAESAFFMAQLSFKDENYQGAVKYLNEAINLFKDEYQKMNSYYLLGHAYIQTGQYSKGRDMGRKMLEINANSGKAYLLISDAYAMGSSSNGTDEISKSGGIWAAVDKAQRAMKVDPSVENEARQRINNLSRSYPSAERLFFYDLGEGSSYKVGGWINEVTTVRGK